MWLPVLLVIFLFITPIRPDCNHPIYCQGDLLDTVQTANIFKPDQKTFVDLKLKVTVNETLAEWEKFNAANPTPTDKALKNFVTAHFEDGNELEEWVPDDFNPAPALLERIADPQIKQFADDLVQLWKLLARKIKSEVIANPDQYSLIPVANGFVIPGGRFKEFYYWDSYWIVRGLIQSEMVATARGMLENFLSIVDRNGFIPNGARIYYLDRSQLPMLTPMVYQWFNAARDGQFIVDHIKTLEQEMYWYLDHRLIEVIVDNKVHELAHFASRQGSPRPESYLEDVTTASFFNDSRRQLDVYKDLRSGAESGTDFTSRWIIDDNGGNSANLSYISVREIIPVDLNAILVLNFNILSDLYAITGLDQDRVDFWKRKADVMTQSIQEVLYNEEDGIWYDYSLRLNRQRKIFYPANFVPLWADILPKSEQKAYGARAAAYLEAQGIMEFEGGIPSSLLNTGEQWDFPNAWAPQQDFVINGLWRSGDETAKKLATELGQRWVKANMLGFQDKGQMFEKYDAVHPGQYGGGGEYTVQSGFGWSNGVALDFIAQFFTNN